MDTHSEANMKQEQQDGTPIQRDLLLETGQLDEQSKVSTDWTEGKDRQSSINSDAPDSNEVSTVAENVAAFDDSGVDHGDDTSNEEVVCINEKTSAQSDETLSAGSFDGSKYSTAPSVAGNAIVIHKAILSSPSRTFASSDESESSQGDEETGGFIPPFDAEVVNKSRWQKMCSITGCFTLFMFVIIPIALVGRRHQKQSNIQSSNIQSSDIQSSNPSNTNESVGITIQNYISVWNCFGDCHSAKSNEPSSSPTTSPPSSSPSYSPSISNFPSLHPTKFPSASPSAAPFVLFTYGESLYRDNDLGIQLSVGLTARQIAQTGSRVSFVNSNGGQSSISYHGMMDGAGIALLPDGGYVYLSNAEKSNGDGGVYGLYFNEEGQVTDYKALLRGTSRNCGGGMSPWNTWISCEEVSRGQCWQVEPDPDKPNHNSPKATLLGGPSGGKYETVAVDNTYKTKPVFFITEDTSNGELRRFEADGNGWDALHVGGRTTYLQFLSGNRFQWTTSLTAGENSAASYYPNAEGIIYHNSTLYFVAKVTRTLFILDLNDMTYTSERTGSSWVGQGAFNSQPDQIIESDLDKRKFIYFTEDGGNAPGVHVRDREGNYFTMARGVPGGTYAGDETVGIAFSPDRRKFYFGFQDAGVLMEVTRDDGQPFN